MSNPAIKVENLSKMYRIGAEEKRPDNLWHATRDALLSPFDYLRRITRPPTEEETLWALKDVSFQVQRGEVLGIIGRNGAGKTTLLKILSRITEPTAGRAEIHGRVGSLLEVGTGFHPELTGRENVYLNGAILGMTKGEIDRKFHEIVAFSGVEKFIDTPVKRYSSGMRVRLAFSVAAHLDPEILLIDEVLAVGDAKFQKKCLGKMGDVASEGRTILFVSHDMGAVDSLCNRAILLSKGHITTNGKTNSVISTYLQSNNFCETEDLTQHPNRVDGLRPLLTKFAIETDNGIAHYGEPLTLRIGYNFAEPVAVPQFCAIFHTVGGVKAFTTISDYQVNDIPHFLQGKGEVTCKIRSLPLLPGDYTVSLRLWQPGQKLDDIENAASLRVEWLNRDYGQFNWNSDMGIVYVEARWQLLS